MHLSVPRTCKIKGWVCLEQCEEINKYEKFVHSGHFEGGKCVGFKRWVHEILSSLV